MNLMRAVNWGWRFSCLGLLLGCVAGAAEPAGTPDPTLVLAEAPWAILGMWTLRLSQDADGQPIIVLNENNFATPFVFQWSD